MTRAPSALAHWQKSRPMPPAAAWTRIVSPAFSAMDAMDQKLDGEPLQEDGGDRLVVDVVGDGHEQRRRHGAEFGIGADRLAGIGDPVAGAEMPSRRVRHR